jgi:hypothetical protein
MPTYISSLLVLLKRPIQFTFLRLFNNNNGISMLSLHYDL